MKGIKRPLKIWLMIAARAAETQILSNWGGLLFLIGKIARFLFLFLFLFSIFSGTKGLAGYNKEQVILFFLVFNLVDITSQFIFRGVYRFRTLIVSGDFDLDLLKPLPSFFRPIFGWTDILDLITLIPLWGYFLTFVFKNHLFLGGKDFILFFILLINSLFISFSFHLFVCSICVLTTEIDHLIWVYRDVINMARFPTDIYPRTVQFILTFAIPAIILVTVPAKALLGLVAWPMIILSTLMNFLFLGLSFWFWRYALNRYSSASS